MTTIKLTRQGTSTVDTISAALFMKACQEANSTDNTVTIKGIQYDVTTLDFNTGNWTVKGDIDASGNSNYPAAVQGNAYRITVAGKIGGADGVQVEVGDVIVAWADNAGGSQAAVGSSWTIEQANIDNYVRISGDLDASGTPNYPAASEGELYTISVGGKLGGASGRFVRAGDMALAIADNAGGDQAAVGTSWKIIQGSVGTVVVAGDTDASGTPNYPAAQKGDSYRITVSGKVGGASGMIVNAGDYIIAVADNAGGDQAAVGASWLLVQGKISGLTTSLTTLDVNAPGTPDFSIADPVDSGSGNAFGFSTADEFKTTIKVIANLQIIVGELKAQLAKA